MSAAEHTRESILTLLAKDGPLTAGEIYEKIDTIDTRQFLYAQINYLKKEGKIRSELGKVIAEQGKGEPTRYSFAKPLKELVEDEAVKNGMWHLSVPAEPEPPQSEPEGYSMESASTHRFTWDHPNHEHGMSLVIKGDTAYLSARRIFTVTPALLREMADLIEENT
jgi:hypothetical protein